MLAPVSTVATAGSVAGATRRRSPLPRRWRGIVAALLGLSGAASFAPLAWAPMSVVAVAGLTLICRDVGLRAGARLGFIFGLAFFLPLLHWSSTFVGALPWLLLAVAQAAFGALLGIGLVAVAGLPYWPVWAAAVWVSQEAIRDRVPFGGFPWGRLAFASAGTPFAPFAALGGAPLVTFVVAGCGTLVAAALLAATRAGSGFGARTGWRPALGLVALAALIPVSGLALPVATAGERGSGPATATVAIIQGNVPGARLEGADEDYAVLGMHVAQTERLAAAVAAGRVPQPDLVVWPENASDLDPYQNSAARDSIDAAATAAGVPVLVGAVRDAGERHPRNSGIVWDPATGPGAVYDKRHLVPFGEYIPWRPLARQVSAKVDLVPQDFLAGRAPGVLQVGPVRLGDLICFEVAFDGLVREAVTAGARLLVVQTNNATFGRSAETAQQLAMARIRAVEHGRAVLIAATTGVSTIIAPDGTVSARSAMFTPATLTGRVALRDTRTIADRLGVAPELALSALGIAAAALGAVRRRRAR